MIGIILILLGLVTNLFMIFGKQELINKLFLLDTKPEDYKTIKIICLILGSIILIAGIIIILKD